MAVQKSKKSRSTRGMRRAHNALRASALSVDPATGEIHLRHHVGPDGYYKGRQVIDVKKNVIMEENENEE